MAKQRRQIKRDESPADYVAFEPHTPLPIRAVSAEISAVHAKLAPLIDKLKPGVGNLVVPTAGITSTKRMLRAKHPDWTYRYMQPADNKKVIKVWRKA